MTTFRITLESIKGIKSLMDAQQRLMDGNYTEMNYNFDFNGVEPLIEAKQKEIDSNIEIVMNELKVSYNVVIDMCFDLEFAKELLK